MSGYVSHVMYPARLIPETYAGPPVEIKSKEDAIWYIVTYKLTRMAVFYTNQVNKTVQSGVQNHAQNWIKPSGPRRPGEGVEECEQGIINAGFHEEGITLTLTQLLAGYLIGPNGTSVRDIMRRTGCHVKSYEENIYLGKNVRTRVFILQAEDDQSILLCLDVILAAADRYKELTEGVHQGKYVNRIQKIKGYVFYYYPPPKNVVPNAAGIKGLPPTKQAKVARDLLGFPSTGSYIAYLDSICHQLVKPQQDKGLTQFIRTTLELPSDDIDDVGCLHPGLFPGKIYEEKPSKVSQNLDSVVVTGFERAVHLKQTIQAAGESEAKRGAGVSADLSGQAGSISSDVMKLAAKLLEDYPEMQSSCQGTGQAQMQLEVANLIMERLGLGSKPIHNTTGVFIKDHQGVDPVVPAPLVYRPSSIGRTSRQCSSTTIDSAFSQDTDQNFCTWPQNSCEGGEGVPLVKNPSFRLTPFGERQTIPSSTTQLPTSVAQDKVDFVNPANMGLILDDLKRIIGNDFNFNQTENASVPSNLANTPLRRSCFDDCKNSSTAAADSVAVSETQPSEPTNLNEGI